MKCIGKWLPPLLALGVVGILLGAGMLWKGGYKQKQYSIIYLPKVIDNKSDFWCSLLEGCKIAADELDVDLEIMAGSSETDFETQNQYIREAIEKNPNAIVVSPISYTENTKYLKEATAKGIHLVLVDSTVEETVQECLVATDNMDAGRKLGELTASYMEEDTQIAMVGHVQGSSTAIEREKGLLEGLGDKAGNIVEKVFCGSNYDKAYAEAKELLEKYPDLEMIVGLNEYSAMGPSRAIRDLGKVGQVKVAGIDGSLEGARSLEEGIFVGLIIQKPFNMGYLSIQKAVSLIRGDYVEPYVDSGSEIITRENMYEEDKQKLLFPFINSQN